MKKVLTIIMAMAFAFSTAATAFAGTWQQGSAGADAVNGVAQTQNAGAANVQYPLAGMLEQLGLNYVGGLDLLTQDIYDGGVPRCTYYGGVPYGLNSSGKYLFVNQCDGPEALNAFAALLSGEDVCKSDGNPADPIDLIANSNNYMSHDQAQVLVNTIRDFLNSFDWKNADDMTKAKKAAKFVEQAKYCLGYDTEKLLERTPYGVLIDKQGDCVGFSTTYHLLTRLMGMDCLYIERPELDHAWNYIKADGIWYKYDAGNYNNDHSLDFTDVMEDFATIEMPQYYDQTALAALGFNQQLVGTSSIKNINSH